MADDLPDLSGEDFRDVGAVLNQNAAALAGLNANANPDEAARSAKLGAAAGVPSNIVHLDPKNFEERLKERTAVGMVGNNPSLAQYAGSDPLASAVSNDDWSVLDTLSHALHSLRQISDMTTAPLQAALGGAASGAMEGLKEGWGDEPLMPVSNADISKAIPALDQDKGLLPGMENTMLTSALNLASVAMRAGGAAFNATTGAIGGGVTGLTGSESLGREARALGEYEMMKPEHVPGGPWLAAGKEPPAGISPELDKAKAEHNEAWLKGLDDAAAMVQQSKTWERSPELFKTFVQQHLGERSISIAGDAVATLYGDKVPAAGDGLLGWVPDIGAKVLAAHVDGSDVTVPLADWLTHMDPKVSQQLHDNVRMWPNGITKAESTVERAQVPPPDPSVGEIGQVRQASGLEPVFRPQQGPGFTVHFNEETSQFLAHDAAGNEIGHLDDGFEAGKGDRPAFTAHTEVEPEWQRKGVATEMYRQFAERHEGNIRPAGNTSAEAWHLWRARYPEKMDAFLKEHPEVMEGVPEEIRPGALAKPQSAGAAASGHPVLIGLHTIDPKTLGIDEKAWTELQAKAQQQLDDDFFAAQKKAERQQKKELTAEWKANRTVMETQVEAETRALPHVAADLFIGSGELNGEKLQQRFTLREADLTPEQKAKLPEHYVSKNGLGVDDVAAHFGFGSGDSMVEALGWHHGLKQGRSAQEMLRDMVKEETDRRMQREYGDLPANILASAHEQALSDVTLDLVTKEYQAAAEAAQKKAVEAGKDPTEAVSTKEQIKERAKVIADGILNKDVNSRAKMQEVAKHYSDAVKGLLGGDPALAVKSLQRRAIAAHVARELLDREKFNASVEKLMKSLGKWKEPGKNEVRVVDPEYVNWAHVIMQKVGQKIRRSTETLMEDIAGRKQQTLEEFVDAKRDLMRPLDVWEKLYDADWKEDWKALNGEEARAVGESLKALDFHGREELKVERAGEVADRDEVIKQMVAQTGRFTYKPVDYAGNRVSTAESKVGQAIGNAFLSASRIPRQFMVNVLQMETFLNYMDKFDPHGTWTQYVMRGLVDGSNQAEVWTKEFTKKLADANDKVDLSKEVDNPIFRTPWKDGEGLGLTFRMTRENLRMVILNAGNSFGAKSNLAKLAKGYGLKPEEVMAWVHAHATKEDWDWAQKVWNNVFEEMWGHGAAMYRSLSGGTTPARVRIDPIETPFGTYRGGYMPVDYHPKFGKRETTDLSKMQQSNYHSALPQASWAKERTGAAYPINLDMSRLPMLITRELHDIAMRPSLIQASKLLLDSRVQDAVASRMGTEYRDMFKPYLIGVANRQNYLTTHPQYANSMLETLRKNLVTGLVGFNPGTVMKHAPTAFILTMREIGPEYMLRAYRSLYSLNPETSQAAHDLVNSFHEIQRRDRNWEETLYGEMLKQRPGGVSETWTNQLAKYAAKPVAWSDMFSARAAALGAYMRAIDEGHEHGDAVYMAERAVRRAHGSMALTNRPQIMRNWNPWFTSVYTFFNDIVNRQMEMTWHAGEMLRDRKEEGGWEAAKAHVPAITASLFAAVIAPAIIEELVSPSGGPDSKDEGLGTKIVKDGFYTLSSGLPGVRDFVHGILSGTDPTPAGLSKTAAGGVQNVYRDLFSKKEPWSKAHAQRLIKDLAGPLAMMSGKVTQSMGNVAAFGYGVAKGQERPKDPWGWLTGLRYGTLRGHSASFGDWTQGKVQPKR